MYRQSLRARLTAASRSHTMREAHASARALARYAPAASYRERLGVALREVGARVRRCPLDRLAAQALAWAGASRACGARFDVDAKALSAFAFSARHHTRSLVVPSKLAGVRSYQDAAAALAVRLESRGGWALCETRTVEDRRGRVVEVYAMGLRLGHVQEKHARTWVGPVGPLRVAAISATGGKAFVTASGDVKRTLRGVNVALEVGAAAEAWSAREAYGITREQEIHIETAAEMEARLRDLF